MLFFFVFWLLCVICRYINRSKNSGYNIRSVNLCNALKVFEVQDSCLSENCVIPVHTEETRIARQHIEMPILDIKNLVYDINRSSLLDGQKFVLAGDSTINTHRKVYGRNDMYVWNKSMTSHMEAGSVSALVVFLMCLTVTNDAKLYSMWHVPVSLCAVFSLLCHVAINAIQIYILPLQISCFFNKLSWELIMHTNVDIATYMINDPEYRIGALQIKKPISLMSSDIAKCKNIFFPGNDATASNTDYTYFERDTAFKRAKYVENMSIKTHNKISDEYMNVVGYSLVGILLLLTVTIASYFPETNLSPGNDAADSESDTQVANITNIFFGAIFAVLIQLFIAVFKAASHAIVSADLYIQSGWLLAKSNGLYHTNNKNHYVSNLGNYRGSLYALFINHDREADAPYLVACIGPKKTEQNTFAALTAQHIMRFVSVPFTGVAEVEAPVAANVAARRGSDDAEAQNVAEGAPAATLVAAAPNATSEADDAEAQNVAEGAPAATLVAAAPNATSEADDAEAQNVAEGAPAATLVAAAPNATSEADDAVQKTADTLDEAEHFDES